MQNLRRSLAVTMTLAAAASAHAATFNTLHSFTGGADGAGPCMNLLPRGDLLYGTTAGGGLGKAGVVFSMSITTGAVNVLHNFEGQDGLYPGAGLAPYNGLLYGTTGNGGVNDIGTVYSIKPRSGAQSVIYSFGGNSGNPDGTLVFDQAGNAYGSATGGAHGDGVIYKLNPSTGAETILYNFTGSQDDAFPQPNLILHGNTIYGTTKGVGETGYGTVFKLNLKTGAETVLHVFAAGADGAYPLGGMVEKSGTLYGTTLNGGTNNDGTIFTINPQTGAEEVVYNFKGTEGAAPEGLTSHNGLFFGTASGGGNSTNGVIYQIDPATWTETTLYQFTGGSDGAWPLPGLVFRHNVAYGATAYGTGTVFSITP